MKQILGGHILYDNDSLVIFREAVEYFKPENTKFKFNHVLIWWKGGHLFELMIICHFYN